MFIFDRKSEFSNSVTYTWCIYLEGIHIGHTVLDIDFELKNQRLHAFFFRKVYIPESKIERISEEFKDLVNDGLLDIDEEPFPYIPYIEVHYGDKDFFC